MPSEDYTYCLESGQCRHVECERHASRIKAKCEHSFMHMTAFDECEYEGEVDV